MAYCSGIPFGAHSKTVNTVSNLDLPATKANDEQEGITGLMLDGYTYPLWKKLRALKYDFIHGVHNLDGVKRWVRIVHPGEDAKKLDQEVSKMLCEEGWEAVSKNSDASTWEIHDSDGE